MEKRLSANISDSVSDTLFIPLYMRSLETKRAHGIINDHKACELVESIDYDFEKYNESKMSQIGTSIRIRHFDQAVTRFVAQKDNPVVVHIGAGLDTRFLRTFKGKGIYYELDLPEVLDFRRKVLPESEHNPFLPYSMFDAAWMKLLRERHQEADFMLIAEGVFMYFDKAQIKPLVQAMAENFDSCAVHFDACSSWGVARSHKHDTVKKTNASFKWALDDDRELEQWAANIRYVDTTYYFSQELRRWGVVGIIGNILPSMRKAFKMLHYEIA